MLTIQIRNQILKNRFFVDVSRHRCGFNVFYTHLLQAHTINKLKLHWKLQCYAIIVGGLYWEWKGQFETFMQSTDTAGERGDDGI